MYKFYTSENLSCVPGSVWMIKFLPKWTTESYLNFLTLVWRLEASFQKRQKCTLFWCVPEVTNTCMQTTDVSFLFSSNLYKYPQFLFVLRPINKGKQQFQKYRFFFLSFAVQGCAANLFRYTIPQENGCD